MRTREMNTILFCTPECASLIDQYIDQRKKAGEQLTKDSYLLRNDFNPLILASATSPRPITHKALETILNYISVEVGLRETNTTTSYQRKNVALFHGFRKLFNTALANCGVNPLVKELLMGHSIGLDDSYFRPNENQVLSEYKKAINGLTINEENRLQMKVNELSSKNQDSNHIIEGKLAEKDKQIDILMKKQEKFEELLQSLIDSGQIKATKQV